jgi:hypothetical protein
MERCSRGDKSNRTEQFESSLQRMESHVPGQSDIRQNVMGEVSSVKRNSVQPSIWVKSRASGSGAGSNEPVMMLLALPEIKGVRPFEPMLTLELAAEKKIKRIDWKSARFVFLPDEELIEVLEVEDEKKRKLVIAAAIDWTARKVILIRGDMSQLDVPLEAFAASGTGATPIFESLAVIDYGQTLQLGKYEASTDALLHDYELSSSES